MAEKRDAEENCQANNRVKTSMHSPTPCFNEGAHQLRGVWVTTGRLEQLIGPKDAQTALEEGWYHTKQDKGSPMLVYYTEEFDIFNEGGEDDVDSEAMEEKEMEASMDSFDPVWERNKCCCLC